MNWGMILDKAISLVTEIENLILAAGWIFASIKSGRENRQLAEIMNCSAVENEEFKKLAVDRGLKSGFKILRKLLPPR